MITFDKVTKEYRGGRVTALEEISLEIDKREFVYLVGPSGAGKTTLLKFLIREEVPSSGDVRFNEESIVTMPARKIPRLRRKIGMVFQDFRLLQQQTIEENIRFTLEVTGRSDSEIRNIIPFLLEKVGLSQRKGSFPRELSTGEQQRVAIARALAHEPEVLLADEPTGNLDTENANQIIELLKQINEWGTTVIMATHASDLVKKNKARVVELKDGKLKQHK
jgi:cell division transport system ATP-binding protein